jgi:hypothetical protein
VVAKHLEDPKVEEQIAEELISVVRVSGFGFRVSGFGFRVQGLGVTVFQGESLSNSQERGKLRLIRAW